MPGLKADCGDRAAFAAGSLQLALGAVDRQVVRSRTATLATGQLLSLADSLARSLPAGPAAVNLCEHRDNFLVGFLALLIRGQVCLLPPSRAPSVVAEVLQGHPGSYLIDDSMVDRSSARDAGVGRQLPDIPPERVVVIGYTSGSTGRPKSNPKTWRSFTASTAFNSTRLHDVLGDAGKHQPPWILATVPPQHMYGMEMSVLLPLLAGMGIHAGHPLYPADIAVALDELPAPRVLVSTPVHLRALLESGVELPALGAVVSATAPLARELAAAVERRFGTTLLEFFGSTETCVIASRRTTQESAWRHYPGVTLRPLQDETRVNAPWFPAEVVLQDVLELHGDGDFVVVGRNADMVEVAGKRASLADLTRRLMAVPGISDGVFFQPDGTDDSGVRRLAALVVAEGLTEKDVLERLGSAMDPVFLPRPLVLVSHLPRNDVGKLPREWLLEALRCRDVEPSVR
jgi:acyl-coenzyme A synthetase/AMP-(fatty) acid ligase